MHFSIDVCIDFMYNKSKLREQSNQKRRKEDERIKKRN
jgi:hypothetical protein